MTAPLSIKAGAICIVKLPPTLHPGWRNRYVTAVTAPFMFPLVCDRTGRDCPAELVVQIDAPWLPPVPHLRDEPLAWCLPPDALMPITDPGLDVNTWTGDVFPMFHRPDPHPYLPIKAPK